MAVVNIPVTVLDEKCKTCRNLEISKFDYVIDINNITTQFTCKNLNFCRFIKNRIIRTEEEEKNDQGNVTNSSSPYN